MTGTVSICASIWPAVTKSPSFTYTVYGAAGRLGGDIDFSRFDASLDRVLMGVFGGEVSRTLAWMLLGTGRRPPTPMSENTESRRQSPS
ncbi:MAG: hypothetical protein U0746_20305 [Gemmataceae bacterium]